MAPVLTVGMPTCNDFNGLWATLVDLHKTQLTEKLIDRIEIVVVDNAPDGKHAKPNRDLVGQVRNARYIPFVERKGTAPAKQEVFRQAGGYAVVCMDSHVMLMPGVLARLVKFWEAGSSDDLFQGPCLHYSMQDDKGKSHLVGTHFTERWGDDGMFGRWGVADVAKDPEAPPFRIAMNGMGLFTAKRSSWLGFHPESSGFGGEEGYVQEKYRQAGRHAWCLPWLRWVHRFGYIDGIPYTGLDWKQRARNYLLGYRELGYPDLAGIRAAYTKSGRLTEVEFEELMKELGVVERSRGPGKGTNSVKPAPATHSNRFATMSALQQGEEELLEALSCSYRGRQSGAVLCNIGCPSMQSQLVTTFDCRKHGLVTLGKRRRDLVNCLGCQDRSETSAEPRAHHGIPEMFIQRREPTQLIVGVPSAKANKDKRTAIRETWAPLNGEVETILIEGGAQGTSLSTQGILRLPCDDGYRSLIQKMQGFCRWILRRRVFQWLLKCDDDTYVAMDRLKLLLDTATADYIGRDFGGFASGGAGYLLSRKAVEIVAAAPDVPAGEPEDVAISQILKTAGIFLHNCNQFEADKSGPWPEPGNSLITGHYVTPRQMVRLHAAMQKKVGVLSETP